MATAKTRIPDSDLKNAVHVRRLVCYDVDRNNKKFWNGFVLPDGTFVTEFGIVDVTNSQSPAKPFGSVDKAKLECDKAAKKKLSYSGDKSAYQEVRCIEGTAGPSSPSGQPKTVDKAALMKVAVEQIQTNNPAVKELIKFLADSNRHTILNNTTIKYDESAGTFRTPLGILTPDAIDDARKMLNALGDYVVKRQYDEPAFKVAVNRYLMTVPQNVGTKLDVRALFPDAASLLKQNNILDSLAASVQAVMAPKTDKADKDAPVEKPKLFSVTLNRMDDGSTMDKFRKLYRETRKDMHVCAHLDVKTVYQISIESAHAAYLADGAKVGGIVEAWHGTNHANLLSIFKGGLVVPPSSAPHVCGRMFGDGVYGAIHSTKSLNYAYGYWDGSRNDRCFMFRMNMAMGKSYIPKGAGSTRPAGYDSIWAKSGQSGVANDELIVPRASQVDLLWLLEFTPNGK